ncbi:MAG: hypothetical protein QM698_07740 [Micropepsaceae bacterium]
MSDTPETDPPQEPKEAPAESPRDEAAPEAPTEAPTEAPAEAPPGAKGSFWSRMGSAAAKAVNATKDAAVKVGHVTAEVARETVHVARDGAAETANMAKHTVNNFDEVRSQTSAAFAKVGKSMGETTAGIAKSASATIASASSEAVKALVRNINEALPFIERAGYRVSEIELGLSVPPKVLLHMMLDDEISDEARAALLQDADGKWFTKQLIERLHNVRQIQRATNFVGMAFDEIEVEIALIPSVILHYRKAHGGRLKVDSPLTDAVEAAEAAEAAATAAKSQPAAEGAELNVDFDVTLKTPKRKKSKKAAENDTKA